MRRRRTSSEQRPTPVLTPSLLPTTPLDSSITAYNCRRIKSRSEKTGGERAFPSQSKLIVSGLGDVFEAADSVFRSSLAYRFPSELTLPPCRREVHRLWRKGLMADDYEQAKTE
jgi:hypothetical protein